MTVLIVVLVGLAGLCLGLRTTSLLLNPLAHPYDRLALSILAGTLWVAVVLELSASYRIFDFGLGLLLSLSPAGLFDVTKWWFRSRDRRSPWLLGAAASAGIVTLRWLFLASVIAAVILAS